MRYRLDSSFPRRGCGEQWAARDAFDLLLSPRVPLRYALPWRSWRLVPHRGESLLPSRRGRCPHRPVAEAPVNHQASGSEKRSNSMRRPPRRPPHHPPRDGSIDLAEDDSVPVGQAKSALAPIRRPPYSNFARMCKVATKAFFLFGPCNRAAVGGFAAYGCGIPLAGTARFSFGKTKEKWGVHSGWTSPLREQRSPLR